MNFDFIYGIKYKWKIAKLATKLKVFFLVFSIIPGIFYGFSETQEILNKIESKHKILSVKSILENSDKNVESSLVDKNNLDRIKHFRLIVWNLKDILNLVEKGDETLLRARLRQIKKITNLSVSLVNYVSNEVLIDLISDSGDDASDLTRHFSKLTFNLEDIKDFNFSGKDKFDVPEYIMTFALDDKTGIILIENNPETSLLASYVNSATASITKMNKIILLMEKDIKESIIVSVTKLFVYFVTIGLLFFLISNHLKKGYWEPIQEIIEVIMIYIKKEDLREIKLEGKGIIGSLAAWTRKLLESTYSIKEILISFKSLLKEDNIDNSSFANST